jgi:hypothetical protein
LKDSWVRNVTFALSRSYPVNLEGTVPAVAPNPATTTAARSGEFGTPPYIFVPPVSVVLPSFRRHLRALAMAVRQSLGSSIASCHGRSSQIWREATLFLLHPVIWTALSRGGSHRGRILFCPCPEARKKKIS